jgi:hypothetical protein
MIFQDKLDREQGAMVDLIVEMNISQDRDEF